MISQTDLSGKFAYDTKGLDQLRETARRDAPEALKSTAQRCMASTRCTYSWKNNTIVVKMVLGLRTLSSTWNQDNVTFRERVPSKRIQRRIFLIKSMGNSNKFNKKIQNI